MITYIDSIAFVAIVLFIALLSWLVLSLLESEPVPFLSNFTFFAFAGQCILTSELVREGIQTGVGLGLLLIGTCLLLFQILTIRAQTEKTLDHYCHLLERNKIVNLSSAEIAHWAAVLIRITGVDFFPEFYMRYTNLKISPHHYRREQAVSILPPTEFRCGVDGITTEALILPPESRQLLWRLYAGIGLLSWVVFISSILVTRLH